jgi:GNAT superfamily N-acetyltransferase
MTYTIRRATAADAIMIADLNRALAWESEARELDPDIVVRGVRALLADPSRGFYTVADQDGLVIGQALITREWSDWRNGWFWWLQSVYVRSEFRKAGVFRRLFEHLQAEARANPEVIGFRLYVEHRNSVARQVYHALGFHSEGYEILGLSLTVSEQEQSSAGS